MLGMHTFAFGKNLKTRAFRAQVEFTTEEIIPA